MVKPDFCRMQLYTAGLLLIRNKKLLLAYSRNKRCFYLPGGKINAGETAKQALCREIREELHINLSEEELDFYTHITAPAFGETPEVIMEQDCFTTTSTAQPIAAAEVSELRYFSLQEYLQQERQAPGAVMILQQLESEKLINP